MQDTISKNTGNSRYLASVPNFLTLYPTYEAFAQALINRELPIDLGPLNPAGLQQIGDNLNKENLLKDETAALYGKPATAVPDDILAAIRPLITAAQSTANGKAQIIDGQYVGTGKSGQSNPNSITFPFKPKIVMIPFYRSTPASDPSMLFVDGFWIILTRIMTQTYQYRCGVSSDAGRGAPYGKKSSDGKTISWYDATNSTDYQLNKANAIYYYVAIG